MKETDAAQGVHRLVLMHGRERAREMVAPKQRLLVDIAAEVLADDSRKIGISYTGFCLTSLPHKKLPDDQVWEKKGHRVTLWVEPGRMKARGKALTYGVPYGARARMILLYLQTQAVRTGSREVELGRSMRDWMERMGLAVGGGRLSLYCNSLGQSRPTGKPRGFRRGAIFDSRRACRSSIA